LPAGQFSQFPNFKISQFLGIRLLRPALSAAGIAVLGRKDKCLRNGCFQIICERLLDVGKKIEPLANDGVMFIQNKWGQALLDRIIISSSGFLKRRTPDF